MAEDLFDAPPPVKRARPVPKRALGEAPGPASLACHCGFREEIKGAAPDRLDCGKCGEFDGLRRFVPRWTPPAHAGRELTAIERRELELDGRA